MKSLTFSPKTLSLFSSFLTKNSNFLCPLPIPIPTPLLGCGQIHVIVGPMFAGKTSSFIRRIHNHSAKDEKEVALCICELNAPSSSPTVISTWVTDSFERKDLEREMLSKLLVNLASPHDGIFRRGQLIEGFKSVLANLEDTVTDAPKAPQFLGRIFARIIMENVLPLKDLGELIYDGGEEPGGLRESGLAAEILGSVLENIKSEQGESVLNEIRAGSNLRLEDFRPRAQLDPAN